MNSHESAGEERTKLEKNLPESFPHIKVPAKYQQVDINLNKQKLGALTLRNPCLQVKIRLDLFAARGAVIALLSERKTSGKDEALRFYEDQGSARRFNE